MPYTTLISAAELKQYHHDSDWAIVDCRFSLGDTERGRRDYLQAHIPGAVCAHLDKDLAGLIVPGQTGRHPLPPVNLFAHTLSQWGIDPKVQMAAYDDTEGAIAACLWWMLRWLGDGRLYAGSWSEWITNPEGPVATV